MADSPRIEELRRRVQSDPASIAFAALAEEYRRSGRFEEAIETCIAGLHRHPSYLSAHVTLGRSLLEVGRYEEAQDELEHVLKLAPENLAAIRGLAEIHHRRGDEVDSRAKPPAASSARPAAPVSAPEPPPMNALDALFDTHKIVSGIPGPAPAMDHFDPSGVPETGPTAAPASEATMHFDSEASGDFELALSDPAPGRSEQTMHEAISDFTPEAAEPEGRPIEARLESVTIVSDAPALSGLEEFLSAILRARANRTSGAR